jgi:hypothetical protein
MDANFSTILSLPHWRFAVPLIMYAGLDCLLQVLTVNFLNGVGTTPSSASAYPSRIGRIQWNNAGWLARLMRLLLTNASLDPTM